MVAVALAFIYCQTNIFCAYILRFTLRCTFKLILTMMRNKSLTMKYDEHLEDHFEVQWSPLREAPEQHFENVSTMRCKIIDYNRPPLLLLYINKYRVSQKKGDSVSA